MNAALTTCGSPISTMLWRLRPPSKLQGTIPSRLSSSLSSLAVCCILATYSAPKCHAAFANIETTPTRRGISSSSSVFQSMDSTSNNDHQLWNDRKDEAISKCILPLSNKSYKGSSGRVGVLGGSARYTGAPYYAAMASLQVGSDLSFVFCAEEAAIPIKTYSPELMVASVYSAKEFDELAANSDKDAEGPVRKMVEEVTSLMDRMHCLVIGPGLGRCPIVFQATAKIIQEAQARKLPIVLDADALFLLTQKPYHNLLQPTCSVILTPNAMERKRLQGLEKNLENCIVVEKGQYDVVRYQHETLSCGEVGSMKRSGGLGDILAGTLGTLVAWNSILTSRGNSSDKDLQLACWTACCFVKRATHQAFSQKRRSMTAPDVLAQLGDVVDHMTNPPSKI